MITVIIGTNLKDAKSRTFAHYYHSLLIQQNHTAQLLDLGDLPDDFIRSALYENNGKNDVFNSYRQLLKQSERFVFIVPEYNGSFPGVLKAFLYGMSYPSELNHKKAALVGLADGVMGGALALSHLSDVLNYMGCTVLAQRVRIPFMKKNFVDNEVQDQLIKTLLEEQIALVPTF